MIEHTVERARHDVTPIDHLLEQVDGVLDSRPAEAQIKNVLKEYFNLKASLSGSPLYREVGSHVLGQLEGMILILSAMGNNEAAKKVQGLVTTAEKIAANIKNHDGSN